MAKIITIANQKGGVAKTTTTASVGALLANKGNRVLLIDLDSQANLTGTFLHCEPESRTIYEALKERKDIPILPIRENLSLVPASLDLAGIELEVGAAFSREFLLKDILTPIADQYDYILLDCPPNLGLILVNAFVASDEVIIPLTAETFPYKGLTKILGEVLDLVKQRLNPDIILRGILITRWEKSNISVMIEAGLREKYKDSILTTKIRKNVSVVEAPLKHQDITSYAPKSNAAQDYLALTEELLALWNKK